VSVTLADVVAARQRIAPHLGATPLVRSPTLSAASGGQVLLKLESQQVTHSFKARGALNALMQAPANGGLIVTASAGNHGLAIAWAAERLGLRALVFTPRSAPRTKTDAITAHGAELRADAGNYEEAEALAKQYAVDHGATFISPYSHPHVIAGAGTIGLELLEQDPALDAVVVPVGGGGLISGVALAVKSSRPSIQVTGVESDASAAFKAAYRAGRIVEIEVRPTIADGLGGNVDPQTITWPMIQRYVDQLVVVHEDSIVAAVRHLARTERVTAEGAGATALAAVLARGFDLAGRRTAVVVTGGNIDRERLTRLLG
jgi:threonine dehydratase